MAYTKLYQNPEGEWAGPKQRQTHRLFKYLGIQDPGDRRAFRMAARGGELGRYFAGRPTSGELFSKLLTEPTDYTGRKARRQERLRQAGSQYAWVGKSGGIPTAEDLAAYGGPPDVVGNRPPNTPTTPPGTAPGPAPGVPSTIEDMLRKMGGYLGPNAQGASNQINQLLNTGGLAPGFENMFKNLLAVHDREGNKNIAALNEAFGARGARYGGDILTAQADMRRQQTQDLASLADQLQLQLGQQQQGLLGLGQQSAQLEQAARENAMQRMFQEYLTQSTQLPPILQQMMAGLTGLPTSNTLAYTG